MSGGAVEVMAGKGLIVLKLIQNPGDVGFVRDENIRMQIQHTNQLGSSGKLVANDEQRARHLKLFQQRERDEEQPDHFLRRKKFTTPVIFETNPAPRR